MRWKMVIAAIGMVVATGATLPAMAQQSGTRLDDPPIPRLPQTGPFELYLDGTRSPGAARLGVTLGEVDAEAAKANKLPAPEGAIVKAVDAGSAAEKGGLRLGDVIVEYDGERVRSASQLARMVRETPTGRFVKIGAMRGGKRIELSVAPSAMKFRIPDLFGETPPGDSEQRFRDFLFRFRGPNGWTGEPQPYVTPAPRLRPRSPLDRWTPGAARLGVVVLELTPQLAEFFAVKEGALVTSVNANSAASRAGLKAGDVITAVDGKPVAGPSDLVQLIGDVPDGREIAIQVVRDKKPVTVKATLAPGSRRPTKPI